ncbi:CDGSH iron-sulfur domain-containing protein [Acidithiobacillus sp. IBUN Pt1247-S3]|uniref:CDGSH iron-sulfur domain-containing protein n=1 Tax=Acidithiobacillus sp. IBUN Pt1247-S3 TaxID=3166642 RepID=UPI0034E4668A
MSKDHSTAKVEITADGPYFVSGGLPLSVETIGTNAERESIRWEPGRSFPSQAQYALCRCGHSENKPFCDGSHQRVGFDGTEIADRRPYLTQTKRIQGPVMSLTDAESLCSAARFCDPHGQVWNLVLKTDHPASQQHFVTQTCDCPSGRLVAWDNKTGEAIEKAFEPSIALIEDPDQHCSGPIWLRGYVQVYGADGFAYEVRNRVTLCRCGASKNKPFCDGSHISKGFRDGL